MKYTVNIKRKTEKQLNKLPENIKLIFFALKEELKLLGPVRSNWTNYSKLNKCEHHCHLKYRYVACWRVNKKNEIEMEVYYVGSREKAPY
jgi:mRNA-degrading endonuclease RelE of RelBE toxin-antitoxin system